MNSLPDFKHGDTFTLAYTYKIDGVPAPLLGAYAHFGATGGTP